MALLCGWAQEQANVGAAWLPKQHSEKEEAMSAAGWASVLPEGPGGIGTSTRAHSWQFPWVEETRGAWAFAADGERLPHAKPQSARFQHPTPSVAAGSPMSFPGDRSNNTTGPLLLVTEDTSPGLSIFTFPYSNVGHSLQSFHLL